VILVPSKAGDQYSDPSHMHTNELVAEINKFNEAAVTAKDKGM